jgi:protein arginine N-methyltransferase 3
MTGEPVSPDTQVQEIKNDDITVAEVWPVGGKAPPQRRKSSQSGGSNKVTSFSTGPRSIPTHWKQTVFLLREPVLVEEGASKCWLDVDIRSQANLSRQERL